MNDSILTASLFGFTRNPDTQRLERPIISLADTPTPVFLAIEPVTTAVSKYAYLRVAMMVDGEERAACFEFASMNALLMATANAAFIASALWELALRLPDNLGEALINTPACDLPEAFTQQLDNTPDMDLDLTRHQIGQMVFLTMGANDDPVR